MKIIQIILWLVPAVLATKNVTVAKKAVSVHKLVPVVCGPIICPPGARKCVSSAFSKCTPNHVCVTSTYSQCLNAKGAVIYRKNVTMPNSMLESGFNLYQDTVIGNGIISSLNSQKLSKEVNSAIIDIQSSIVKNIKKMFVGPFWNLVNFESSIMSALNLL